MTQRGSSLDKVKLARQIEELRENGETANDYSNYSRKNYCPLERNWYVFFCAVLV